MTHENYNTKSAAPSASATEMLETNPRWKHLFAFTSRRHLHYLIGGGLSSAAAAALRTVLAIILGRVFDVVAAFGNGQKSGPEALSGVSRYCVILAALGVAQWIVNALFLATWIIFGETQASAVRVIIFKGLLKMGKAWFDSLPDGPSGLVASIQRKTHELQVATSQVFGYLLADLLTALGSLIVAFYTSWRLTLVLLSTIPVSIAVIAFTGHKIQPAIKMQALCLDSASKLLAGSLSGIDVVKMCNGYNHETNSYMAQIKHAARQYRLQARFNSIQIGYIRFWAVAIFVVGFWYGLVLVQKGERPGQILTTFYSVLAALQGVESLLPNWLVFEKGMSAGQVLQALEAEVTGPAEDDCGSVRPDYFVGTIDLRGASFSYPTTPTITCLERCTLSIAGGQSTFLVGHSGSGKSTIAQLITRVYDTADDSIYIDGWPIKTLQLKWIQQHIMLVEQTPVIFSDTLFRNIMLGHRNPDSVRNHQVLEACRIFGLESTLASIPGGLHAAIGGKGCPLSVGQRQRIVLARAYLRDPAILILDEPTSALDQSSRECIMDEIRKWRKGKTTVFISHDLAGINENDFAYVLDKGAVIEQGFQPALELNPQSMFYSASLDQKELDNTTQIEINIIPPPADDTVPESKRYSGAPLASQSFLLGQSNPARYSTGSFLSPRISMFSGGIRPVAANMIVSPTYVPVTNTEPADQSQPRQQLQAAPVSRASSFIHRHFQSTPWRSSFAFNVQNSTTSSPQSSPSSVSISAGIDRTKHDPARKRPLVNLGVLPKNSNNMSNLSFFQILQTVIPALKTKAVALFAVGIVATIIGALTTPAFSFCLAELLAAMWSSGDKSNEGKRWALYLVVIAVVDGVFSGTGHYLLDSSAQSWVDSLRRSASQKILRQPKSWLMEGKNSPTRIIETLDVHCEEMRNTVGRFVPIMLSVTAMVFSSVVWALIVSWKLSLVALAPLPLVITALKGYTYLGYKWETQCANGVEETGTILGEVLASIRTIRNYTLENYFIAKYTRSNNRCLGLGFRRAWYSCPLFGLYQAFSYGLTALLFYYGTSLLANDETVSVGKILQVMNLLLFSISSATELLSAMPQITMTTASASRVLAYTQLPEGEPEYKTTALQGSRASPLPIRMRDLSFTYPGNEHSNENNGTLSHFNLDILPGQCTVIVGPSGSGKSTILSLLLGLQKPTQQFSLTYAGRPCSVVHPQQEHQLRDAMGYVPQTPFLFPATILANILYGLDPSSPLCHLTHARAAARDAHIDEYVMSLPEGYDTVVGEGGLALSGGQAQRITIARALVRRPTVLVMDEPTSALDAENARFIRACVADLVARWKAERRSAAVVIVTHNVDMMRAADTIVVVERGRNVEQGAFGDLWFNGDAFRRLISRKDGGN